MSFKKEPSNQLINYYNIKNTKIFVKSFGNGFPLIFLHGFGVNHKIMENAFEPVFKAINNFNYFKRIYIDLPGMGNSTFYKNIIVIKNADDMVDVLFNLILRIIKNKSNFALIGESYGGYLANGIIKKFAEQKIESKISGLFLLCPVIYPDFSLRNTSVYKLVKRDNDFYNTLDESIKIEIDQKLLIQTRYTIKRFTIEVIEALKKANKEFLKYYKKFGYKLKTPFEKSEEIIKSKHLKNLVVSILTGENDNIVGYKDAKILLQIYKNAKFEVIKETGHFLQIEKPETFNFYFTNWLNEIKGKL